MPVRILFVCYENICRSPMAEGVFRHLSDMHGVAGHFEVMSAGTVCYQSGSYPDPRAIRAAARYGFDISENRAQCIHDLDLSGFDRVFVMDCENYHDVLETLGGVEGTPVHMMTDFADAVAGIEIEDPYYGPEEGFDSTLSMLAHCVDGILRHMREMHGIVPEDAGAVISSETVQAAGNDSGR
ncbi:MAG: low molecular weight phosphotyrosine protein phosphatase [Chlorobiaceae bacterium]|nr:low molecular weight phosphotyrosine protein phosphatase [Chlorobiaceae bacterium]